MPVNPISKLKFIFVMNTDAPQHQRKHIRLPEMKAIEAYNLMLKTYGEVSWSEMLEQTEYQQKYDMDRVVEAGMFNNFTDLFPKLQ